MLIAPLLLTCPAWVAPTTPQEPSVQDILLIMTEGGESLFTDPKDQALLRALQLVDDRLLEAQGEIPDFPRELALVMPLISRLASGPMTLRIGSWNNATPDMGPPFFGQLTLKEQDAGSAQAMANMLTQVLTSSGMPEPEVDEAGRVIIPAPMPAWYGVEGNDLKITLGQTDGGELAFGQTGLPDGVQPLVAMSLEYGAMMQAMMNMAAMSGDMEAMQVFGMLDQMGILDLSLQAAYGTDDELGYTVMSMPGYAAKLREAGMASERTLEARDFARIPADSQWAVLNTVNVSGILDMYIGMAEDILAQQGMTGDPMAMVSAQLGFDPRADLFDHLGSSFGMFASDTTGGGGFASIVGFMEVKNADGLNATLAQLKGMLNAIAGMQAQGYVRVQDWEMDGVSYSSLIFPGLPVPLELTYAMDGGYMFVGMTPQSVVAAVTHARQNTGGLLANQRFTSNLAGGMEGLIGTSFLDTPRLIADGYGLALMLGSALRNGTRSPEDESRDVGPIVPSYPVLVQGSKASVTATRYAGDDVVAESRGDRSMLVNFSCMVGAVTSSPIVPLVALGAAGGAAAEMQQRRAMEEWMEMPPPEYDEFEEDEDY